MSPDQKAARFEPGSDGVFASTHWSVVLLAGEQQGEPSRQALARLCETYRPPVLAFALRLGLKSEDAEDLTQSFFVHFLKNNLPAKVARRESTKFRSFLLRCLKNFLADERERGRTQRRGGGQQPVSLDETDAQGNLRRQPADQLTAERVYERKWAMTLLNLVLTRLETEYVERGRGHLFVHLQPYLLEPDEQPRYAETARLLDMTDEALRKEVSRTRHRYRELFRQEIANTINDVDEIADEMRHLFVALSR